MLEDLIFSKEKTNHILAAQLMKNIPPKEIWEMLKEGLRKHQKSVIYLPNYHDSIIAMFFNSRGDIDINPKSKKFEHSKFEEPSEEFKNFIINVFET